VSVPLTSGFRDVWIVARKDVRMLTSHPPVVVVLLAVPLILAVLLAAAFEGVLTGSDTLKIGVADLDKTATSSSLISGIESEGGATVELLGTDGGFTRADAGAYLDDSRRLLVLVVPAGFGAAIARGERTDVSVYGDPARQGYANLIIDALRNGISRLPTAGLEPALRFRDEAVVQGTSLPGTFEQLVPGFTLMFSVWLAGQVAFSVYYEKKNYRTWNRILIAPLSRPAILAGKLVAAYAFGVIQVALLISLGVLVFGMEVGNVGGLALTLLVFLAFPACLGVLFAALFDEVVVINSVTNLLVIVLGILGGAIVPIFLLPAWMEQVAVVTPHYWAMTALQDLMFRGAAIADVTLNLLVLALFAGFALGLGLVWFRFRPVASEA
jgi:ABC-2 type transport system permease protein